MVAQSALRRPMAADSGVSAAEKRMALLSQRAQERARSAIMKRVSKGVLGLEAIDELRDEYEGVRRKSQSQIHVALMGKSVSVRAAIDSLGSAAEASGKIKDDFEGLRRSTQAKRGQSFPRAELEEASIAIRNLKSLLVQIDFYSSIPSRCGRLRKLLKTAPEKYLKEAYKRAMELETWRSALNREVSAAADRARRGEEQGVDLSALVDVLASHFADVGKLVNEVFAELHRCLEHGDIAEMARNEPARLVACAQVVEMHELLQARLAQEAVAGEPGDALLEKLRASPLGAPSRDDALRRLFDSARRRAAKLFAEHQMRLADEDCSHTSALVGAATKLVVDLDKIRKFAAPCVPDNRWKLVRVVRAAYEAHLERQLSPLWTANFEEEDGAGLDVADLVQVSEWLDHYNAVIQRVDCDEGGDYDEPDVCDLLKCPPQKPKLLQVGVSESFRRGAQKLVRHYLDQVSVQVEKWFSAIRVREASLRKDSNGRWLTTRPEDMFQIVGTQLAVAKEHAERAKRANSDASQHVATVFLRCLEELRADAARSLDKALACSSAVDDYMLRGLVAGRRYYYAADSDDDDDFQLPELDEVRRARESTVMPGGAAGEDDDQAVQKNRLRPEQLCAMANDALRVQERTEDLVESSGVDNEAANASVRGVADDVVSDYGQVALSACEAAAAAPFVDLRDAVFAASVAPGSEEWQNWPEDKPDAVDSAIRTLDDYFEDYREWLPDVLFAKLLRSAFSRLLASYVNSFLRTEAPFEDNDSVAMFLLRDQNKILEYFAQLTSAGFRSDVENVARDLAVLRDLADVVVSAPPDIPEHALQSLVAEFGTDAHTVLLSLVARHPVARKPARVIPKSSSKRRNVLAQSKNLLNTVINTMPDGPKLATTLPKRFKPFSSLD